jgi:hypothetical protein
MIKLIIELSKNQPKRLKNRRSIVISLSYLSHLSIHYGNAPNRANDLLKDYYSFKNE